MTLLLQIFQWLMGLRRANSKKQNAEDKSEHKLEDELEER